MLIGSNNSILAKTPKDPRNIQPRETLLGHTQDVVHSFSSLFGTSNHPTRLAHKWFHFFGLDCSQDWDMFQKYGRLSCYFHDIGKANSGFHNAVWLGGDRQIIRHEHLSALLVMYKPIREWLKYSFSDFEPMMLASIILGHHLKSKKDEFAISKQADNSTFQLNLDGLQEIFDLIRKELNSEPVDCSAFPKVWDVDKGDCADIRQFFCNEARSYFKQLEKNDKKNQMFLSLRSALIAADSVGSGIMRVGFNLNEWIQKAFSENNILDGYKIDEAVINPRIDYIKNQGKEFVWREFQQKIESLPERTLLLTSCGSGKTLAAWRWIKAQADKTPVSRVIFLYPTRGTATEGFKDYVSWAPEADAALIHGSSSFELADLFSNPVDSDDVRRDSNYEVDSRLYALGYWNKRIFSATVDQFLGFMQLSYRSLCLMPVLVDSIIVIDEVHSFDHSLFSALKLFLEKFQIPVLCMTASLSEGRKKDLKELGLTIYPDPAIHVFEDLTMLEEMPRYEVKCLEGQIQAIEIAKQKLEENRKVLWVVNTVSRCQQLASQFPDAICYHSRFTLSDRKIRHRSVIDKFSPPILALTTQVCEMSLDLDADVLITEYAPISSMIQRMGRCNRHARPDENKLGEVVIYPPEKIVPYEKEDMENVSSFVESIQNRTISQMHLNNLLEQFGQKRKEWDLYSAFFDCGPWADSREKSIRDEDGYTVQAVLDGEIEQYLLVDPKQRDGFVLPVPRRFSKADSRLPRWLKSAPSSHYQPRLGFLDTSVKESI